MKEIVAEYLLKEKTITEFIKDIKTGYLTEEEYLVYLIGKEDHRLELYHKKLNSAVISMEDFEKYDLYYSEILQTWLGKYFRNDKNLYLTKPVELFVNYKDYNSYLIKLFWDENYKVTTKRLVKDFYSYYCEERNKYQFILGYSNNKELFVQSHFSKKLNVNKKEVTREIEKLLEEVRNENYKNK